ncbi:MAG: hypothetical protein HYU59_00730 [Magnetospirillum gryphiswaldense]|nr:hypothetical protein [Magnetospirillum gryphiswaldense]
MSKQITQKLTMFPLALALTACAPNLNDTREVDYSEQAGNVYVSATPAIAWSDISEKLQPKLGLTMDKAMTMAAVTTRNEVSQYLSAFGAALNAGLPNRSSSSSTIFDDSGSKTSGTRTHAPGTVPNSSGLDTADVDNSSLSVDLTKLPAAPGIDGNTLISHAVALYQYGQMLDNAISKAILPEGYIPYLLTLQIDQQPTARNLPYDTYVDVALLPPDLNSINGLKDPKKPSVIVYPLIISDAMETIGVSKSVETIRQASLGISGLLSGIGVNAGLSGAVDKLQAALGTDRNSLITVGRVGDNMLRVRLGAYASGSAGPVMAARAYNISLMVLVADNMQSLGVNTHTSFADVKTGAFLSGEPSSRFKRALYIANRFCGYGFTPTLLGCDKARAKLPEDDDAKSAWTNHWMNILQKLDHGRFQEVLSTVTPPKDGDPDLAFRKMTMGILSTEAMSRNSDFNIFLGKQKSPVLPDDNQLAFLRDDGKATSLAVQRGVALKADTITASLELAPCQKLARCALPANDVKVNASGGVDATFPSLKTYGLNLAVGKALSLQVGDAKPLFYSVLSVSEATQAAEKKQAKTSNPVSTQAKVVVTDATGQGQLTLVTGKLPKCQEAATVLSTRINDVPQGDPLTVEVSRIKAR